MLEVFSMGVGFTKLKFCIDNFITFAEEKGYSGGLSSKFITHVKIMIQNKRVPVWENCEP